MTRPVPDDDAVRLARLLDVLAPLLDRERVRGYVYSWEFAPTGEPADDYLLRLRAAIERALGREGAEAFDVEAGWARLHAWMREQGLIE
jgi:hypothetical protein